MGLQELKLIQAALQGKVVLKEEFEIISSKEYGASRTLMEIAKNTGLDRIIYSRPSERWVGDASWISANTGLTSERLDIILSTVKININFTAL